MNKHCREGVTVPSRTSTDNLHGLVWGAPGAVISNIASRWRTALALFACGAAFAAPAMIDGAPFLYFDSADYIYLPEVAIRKLAPWLAPENLPDPPGQPAQSGDAPSRKDDGHVLAGRSLYYGTLAYFSSFLSVWPLVIVQSLVLAWLTVLAFIHTLPGRPVLAPALTALALAFLSPAAFYAGMVMPDIWAGMMILAAALLIVHHDSHSAVSRWLLAGIMVFSVLSHASHLALLLSMTVLAAGAWAVSPRIRRLMNLRAIAVLGLCGLCGIAGQVAFTVAVDAVYGQPPIRMPFVTAHLVDLGPGTAHARSACPEAGYALCAYVDRLPVGWIQFLFDSDPETGIFRAGPAEVQRALYAEQWEFAAGTIMADPVGSLGGLAWDGIRQLWHISVTEIPLDRQNEAVLTRRFPAELAAMTRDSLLYSREWLASSLSYLTYASTGLSLLALLIGFGSRAVPVSDPDRNFTRLTALVVICMSGVVLNAIICGILASPYARFQSRVSWIIPLMAAVMISAWFHGRRKAG